MSREPGLMGRAESIRKHTGAPRGNWEPIRSFFRYIALEGKYNTKEVWEDIGGKPLHPHTNYYVGGNTKFYGPALFRLRKEDFGEIRHHGGISPAWPVSCEDLEPYYLKAEHLYHVHGRQWGRNRCQPPNRLDGIGCKVD